MNFNDPETQKLGRHDSWQQSKNVTLCSIRLQTLRQKRQPSTPPKPQRRGPQFLRPWYPIAGPTDRRVPAEEQSQADWSKTPATLSDWVRLRFAGGYFARVPISYRAKSISVSLNHFSRDLAVQLNLVSIATFVYWRQLIMKRVCLSTLTRRRNLIALVLN